MYIHIPFCEYICHYCDFVKRVPKTLNQIDTYLIHLKEEMMTYEHHFPSLNTIYIGGGTPSMLSPSQLKVLLEPLANLNVEEFTIEVNPESYTHEKGEIFKQYGINRVSLGVQTFDHQLLNYVNRKHTNDQVFDCVAHLKSIGINHISVDLIYAIPGQTLEMLKLDLDMIHKLNIDHVSCYSLILEDKTYFYHQYKYGKFFPVDNELEADMFDLTIKTLKTYGFEHYEISNFAKHKKYSKHNLLYWTLEDYLGLGLGAHGFYDNVRTYNHKAMPKYYEHKLATKVLQNKQDLMTDYMIFGLRKLKGVSLLEFTKRFDEDALIIFKDIIKYIDNGFLILDNDHLYLSQKGLFLGNQVFEIFI